MGNWIREIPLKRGSLFVLLRVSRFARFYNNWPVLPRDLTADCTPLFVDSFRKIPFAENCWNSPLTTPISRKKNQCSLVSVKSGSWPGFSRLEFSTEICTQRGFSFVVVVVKWNRIGYWQNNANWQIIIWGESLLMWLESGRSHSLNEQRLGKMSRLITVLDTKGERCWGALSKERVWKYSGGRKREERWSIHRFRTLIQRT